MNFATLKSKRYVEKFILFAILSIIIGYLISPKIIFQPRTYQEGDIILQTININEDLLIPDKVSTRLKTEKLLKEQRRIYDFDPKIYEQTQALIQENFQKHRDLFQKLEKQSLDIDNRIRSFGLDYFNTVSSLQVIRSQIVHYKRYQKVLNKRLNALKGDGRLSEEGFVKKAKIDLDLGRVSQILSDLQEKQKYFQLEKDSFSDRYLQMKTENEDLLKGIEEKKREAIANFDQSLSIEMTESEKQLLDFQFYSREMETQLMVLLSEILSRKIVVSKEILPEEKEELEIRNLVTGDTSIVNDSLAFLGLAEARNLVSDVAKEFFDSDETGKKKNLLIILAQNLVRATVSENKQEYENRKAALISNISPVFFSVKKGEIIARAGDRATQHQVELINSYYETASNKDKIPGMIGVILFVLIALIMASLSFGFLNKIKKTVFRHYLLIMTTVLVTLLLVKGGALLGELIETRYYNTQSGAYNFMLPVALGSMLVGILLGFESALIAGLLTALFCSIMMQSNLYYFFYAIMGSIIASIPMTRFDSRYSILLHGLKISAINLPMMMIIYLIESNQLDVINWFSVAAALFGGVLTAILTSILLPFFESIFDITTNLKLLELSNMNHPALKELILKAPGTYQHSIIVGNLAESGAIKVGANPLLSRVAAYYHDIGKAVDSQYYIENQSPNYPNIHDSMDPHDSAKMIIRHLEKGVELSEKYRLGRTITDILLQHHGTTLVKYFYNKARKQNGDADEQEIVDMEDYRYPGPKPQSIEAALIMLADISEACSRSLDSPTPEKIKEMIENVCWKIMEDGQLDDSGLTLKTYHEIIEVYSTMLVSFHHHRVKYPEDTPPPALSN